MCEGPWAVSYGANMNVSSCTEHVSSFSKHMQSPMSRRMSGTEISSPGHVITHNAHWTEVCVSSRGRARDKKERERDTKREREREG